MPTLEEAAATLQAYVARAGAVRAMAVVVAGEEAKVLDCLAGQAVVEVGEDAEQDRTPVASGVPLELGEGLRPVPASALSVDVDAGRVEAPLGAVSLLAEGVVALAKGLGDGAVATADFATRDADVLLTVAAREGEPVVLAVGDQQFALPDGWPGG